MTSSLDSSILLVGCGKMGGAMLAGWIDRGLAANRVLVVEPAPALRQQAADTFGVATVATADALPESVRPDVVVLAVKPQAMTDVVPEYRRFATVDTVFLSIAAGKTLAWFAQRLGSAAAIVRAMPNTPAAIRRGMTVACANLHADKAQRRRCDALLTAVGEVAWVEEETMMDAVTAVSGSGPAYVFLLAEALAAAGAAAGLPADLAARLARATVAGSGELLRIASESPAILRQNVTSPGGTTAAALAVLMGDNGMESLLTAAVNAATRRSRELAG
ncbi:MAG: pyrroline-5-carboxylate reductase [Alphaproteobacteria bacterium]|nr:pyrroline-5-carboxylate reductase [Alphaproteobacteria bacterium]